MAKPKSTDRKRTAKRRGAATPETVDSAAARAAAERAAARRAAARYLTKVMRNLHATVAQIEDDSQREQARLLLERVEADTRERFTAARDGGADGLALSMIVNHAAMRFHDAREMRTDGVIEWWARRSDPSDDLPN